MSKNKTRLIVVTAAIVTIISTFCYAETESNQITNTNIENSSDAVTTDYENPNARDVASDDETETTNTTDTSTTDTSNQNVYNGDLYIFDSDVTMDKLVDGNVFIIGNNVTITGQCSGNMFILGNNVTFDKSFVQASVFVCGNNVKFNAVSNSLYSASKNLTIEHQFGVYTDMYSTCSNLDFDGIVGRNAFLSAGKVNLHENSLFYGDLNYSASSETEIPEGAVEGTINYSKITEKTTKSKTIFTYLSDLVQFLIFGLLIFLIVKLFTKDPCSKECSVLSHPGKTFGIGILSIILIPIIFLLLLLTIIGATASLAVLSIYCIILMLSTVIFAISLARYLCISKKNKTIKELLITLLALIVIWGLSLVPFIGWLISFICVSFGFGIIIYSPLYKKFKCKNKDSKKITEDSNITVEKTDDSSKSNDEKTNDK